MKILKSQIKDEAEFRDTLEKLCAAKQEHLTSGTLGVPPPSTPFLDSFIKRTRTGPDTPDEFTIDCEIVNDDPGPEELNVRALNELRAREQAELAALIPPNMVRLMQMEATRAFKVPEDERKPEHIEAIAHWQDLQKKTEEIQYEYAKREAAL